MGAATRFVQNPGNNAICYYRYSSDAQRDVSIVQQKDAAHEYAEGVPMQKICNSLNESGIKTNRGNKFTVNALRHILTHRASIGEYKFGDVLIPDGMPRLIDNELFQAVQARLEANKRGGKGAVKKLHPEIPIENYWLSGKLYCGLCGGTLQGVSGTGKRGGLYYYYSCMNHRKHASLFSFSQWYGHVSERMKDESSARIQAYIDSIYPV